MIPRRRSTTRVSLAALLLASSPSLAADPLAPPPSLPAEQEEIDIRADRFHADGRTGRGVFEGSVRVTRGPLALTCDRLEVTYDRRKGEVARVEARGSVQLVLEGRRADGGEAIFDVAEGTLILRGAPVLHEEAATLRGEEIRVRVGDRTVQCVRCRATWQGGRATGPGRR